MISFNANAVVHISESLSDDQIHDIERNLADIRGLVVDYDPQSLRAQELLHHVARNGLHAALIGGI